MPSQELEDRVANLEALLERAVSKARETPVGRKILAMLGIQ